MQELDWETLAAGLLHDTVEDTDVVTFERIEEEFGPTVRRIVEGETKVTHVEASISKIGSDSMKFWLMPPSIYRLAFSHLHSGVKTR